MSQHLATAAPPPWTDYDTHARTRPADDLWGQVRRTVRGEPVPAAQIDMIVDAIRSRLALTPADTVLDIACGNGALSHRLFPACAAWHGIDLSDYLIGIANARFAGPAQTFLHADAAAWAEHAANPARFTKALCYGSLSYLPDPDVARLLHALRTRFTGITRILLGNLPDPGHASAFYAPGTRPPLYEPRSDIGVWRSRQHLQDLAGSGWTIEATVMPAGFFARHYRFDALLTRAA